MWIIHPKPVEDELLSSWMLRVCRLRGVRPYSFSGLHWPGLIRWNSDVDLGLYRELTTVMAEGTGTSLDRARLTTLDSLRGLVFERWPYPATGVPWVLWTGLHARRHTEHGLQYCPACLADREVYRRTWRLAWAVACPRHGCWLRDACPACDAPVAPVHAVPAACVACGASMLVPTGMADPEALALVVEAEAAIRAGWGRHGWVSRHQPEGWPAVIWFDVLRQLAKVLLAGRRSQALRREVAERFGGGVQLAAPLAGRHQIEATRHSSRATVIGLAGRLLARWPESLSSAASAAGMWRSWLLRDLSAPRFPLLRLADALRPPDGPPTHGRREQVRRLTAARLAAPVLPPTDREQWSRRREPGRSAYVRLADAGPPRLSAHDGCNTPPIIVSSAARKEGGMAVSEGAPNAPACEAAPELEVQVAAAVVEIRLRAGLTHAQLARRMGELPATVHRLEKGRHLPGIRMLARVARAAGHTIVLELS